MHAPPPARPRWYPNRRGPRVVISSYRLIALEARHRSRCCVYQARCRARSLSIRRMRAVAVVGVGQRSPPASPVRETTGQPHPLDGHRQQRRWKSARPWRAERPSPAWMAIGLISCALAMRSSVVSPCADTTTTTSLPALVGVGDDLRHVEDAFGILHGRPAELLYNQVHMVFLQIYVVRPGELLKKFPRDLLQNFTSGRPPCLNSRRCPC